MKRSYIFSFKLILLSVVLVNISACEDFISIESNRFMLSDDHTINTPNDTVYSLVGILSKVQRLSDRYVLMGELRGDLMAVTPYTESDMRNLHNFEVDAASSQFSDLRPYYAIINNCNFFIERADTAMVHFATKPFVKEVAVAKTIRAWTYFQIALNYGKVSYFEEPILSVNDINKTYPEYNLEQIIDTLIASLIPIEEVPAPAFGTLFNVESRMLFVNTKFLLGDLHLWKASHTGAIEDYELAADYYAKVIDEQFLTIRGNAITWRTNQFLDYTDNWSPLINNTVGNSEMVTLIKLSNSSFDGGTGRIAAISAEGQLTSTARMDEIFAIQNYAYPATSTVVNFTMGDLRAKAALTDPLKETDGIKRIRKYQANNVIIYRAGLAYLRYAEAVNRAGRPGLAFAVLKFGVSSRSMSITSRVPPRDLTPKREFITIFENSRFDVNMGIHSRGSGNSDLNTRYAIPLSITTKADSIDFVEDYIVDELAMETGFEGNRFHDLMRFAHHRNDPGYLANKVAQKYTDYQYYLQLLSDPTQWFLPARN